MPLVSETAAKFCPGRPGWKHVGTTSSISVLSVVTISGIRWLKRNLKIPKSDPKASQALKNPRHFSVGTRDEGIFGGQTQEVAGGTKLSVGKNIVDIASTPLILHLRTL